MLAGMWSGEWSAGTDARDGCECSDECEQSGGCEPRDECEPRDGMLNNSVGGLGWIEIVQNCAI